MSQVQELLAQVKKLDRVDQEELLIAMERSLLLQSKMEWLLGLPTSDYPSVVSTPGVCGGSARLVRTRIPIWVLWRMRQLGVSELDIMRSYPTLRAADLVQAWSYAASHRPEIEEEIRENEAEIDGDGPGT
jgi:uncharacterized protein (DUF433 family)